MLKTKQRPNNLILWVIVGVLILSGIITLITAFSSSDDGLDEVNASYTSAAETLAVQQLTLQAASPTATVVLFTPTFAFTATPFLTPTVLFQTTLASPTTSSGGGSTAVGCDNSVYVADVTIPDNTAMLPGQAFTKTWKLQNNGTCPWTTSYNVTFLSGNAMSGVTTPLTITVQPNQSVDISVNMIAPATAGDAKGTWILSNANGQQFGTDFFVLIKVGSAGTTGTVASTPTTGAPALTATFTPIPTETLTATITPVP